jgi:hypothetical protein
MTPTVGQTTGSSLHQILEVHCQSADIAYAALLEESGVACADAGDETLRDHGEMASLAVGAYHATREVARRLGETAFEGLSHEGRDRHFHLSPAAEGYILLSVFTNDTLLALVRASARRTGAAIRVCLAEAETPSTSVINLAMPPEAALQARVQNLHSVAHAFNEGDILVADGDFFAPTLS